MSEADFRIQLKADNLTELSEAKAIFRKLIEAYMINVNEHSDINATKLEVAKLWEQAKEIAKK